MVERPVRFTVAEPDWVKRMLAVPLCWVLPEIGEKVALNRQEAPADMLPLPQAFEPLAGPKEKSGLVGALYAGDAKAAAALPALMKVTGRLRFKPSDTVPKLIEAVVR